MDIKAKITELAGSCLLNSSQFLVEVVASNRNFSKITVILDGDHGVTIEDISQVSRDLSKKLDEVDFGTEHYVLEVTTPGLDHPLKLQRQYKKNVGRSLKVHRKDKSLVQGKLIAADEPAIMLKQEVKQGKIMVEKEVMIPYEEIEKAFVMVSFK